MSILLPLPEMSYHSFPAVQTFSPLFFLQAFIEETIFSPYSKRRSWHSPSCKALSNHSISVRSTPLKRTTTTNQKNKKPYFLISSLPHLRLSILFNIVILQVSHYLLTSFLPPPHFSLTAPSAL